MFWEILQIDGIHDWFVLDIPQPDCNFNDILACAVSALQDCPNVLQCLSDLSFQSFWHLSGPGIPPSLPCDKHEIASDYSLGIERRRCGCFFCNDWNFFQFRIRIILSKYKAIFDLC